MLGNDFHSVILYSEDVKSIYNALVSSGHSELASKVLKKSRRTKADKRYIDAALFEGDSEHEYDNDPVVSKANDGAYVMAWKWINKIDIECKESNFQNK